MWFMEEGLDDFMGGGYRICFLGDDLIVNGWERGGVSRWVDKMKIKKLLWK